MHEERDGHSAGSHDFFTAEALVLSFFPELAVAELESQVKELVFFGDITPKMDPFRGLGVVG